MAFNANASAPQSILPSIFTSDPFWLVASALAAVILTFAVQTYLNAPKIRGSILTVIRSEWINPGMEIHKNGFWAYVYLTNYHQNPITLLDYELEADFGKGWVKLERVYGDLSKIVPDVVKVKDQNGNETEVRNMNKHSLTASQKSVSFGDFNHGIVMFAGDLSLAKIVCQRYRFTCIDVFGKKHAIEARKEEMVYWNRVLEILNSSG